MNEERRSACPLGPFVRRRSSHSGTHPRERLQLAHSQQDDGDGRVDSAGSTARSAASGRVLPGVDAVHDQRGCGSGQAGVASHRVAHRAPGHEAVRPGGRLDGAHRARPFNDDEDTPENEAAQCKYYEDDNLDKIGSIQIKDFRYVPERTAGPCGLKQNLDKDVVRRVLGWHAGSSTITTMTP